MNRHIRVTQEAGLNSLEKAAKGVTRANPLGGGDEEAAGAGGGVADEVAGFRGGEFHHEGDDLAGGAELVVLPGDGDFAEHVFVELALGVAVVHGDFIDEVDDFGEEGGGGDGEAGVLHVLSEGGGVAAEGAEEGEDAVR